MTPLEMIVALGMGHAMADYPLQGPFMSDAKRRKNPAGAHGRWIFAMTAHCLIHGAFVWYITGFFWLGIAEVFAHAAIDVVRCEKLITFKVDQLLHVACKFAWWALAVWVL